MAQKFQIFEEWRRKQAQDRLETLYPEDNEVRNLKKLTKLIFGQKFLASLFANCNLIKIQSKTNFDILNHRSYIRTFEILDKMIDYFRIPYKFYNLNSIKV